MLSGHISPEWGKRKGANRMRVKPMVAVCALVLLVGLVVRAQDKTKPIKRDKPSSKLNSHSDDQKTKINDLHQKALAEIKAIRDKEEADCTALLTDAQKTELKKIEDAEKAAAKEKRAGQPKDGQEK